MVQSTFFFFFAEIGLFGKGARHHKTIVVLGHAGSGKTSLCKALASRHLQGETAATGVTRGAEEPEVLSHEDGFVQYTLKGQGVTVIDTPGERALICRHERTRNRFFALFELVLQLHQGLSKCRLGKS